MTMKNKKDLEKKEQQKGKTSSSSRHPEANPSQKAPARNQSANKNAKQKSKH